MVWTFLIFLALIWLVVASISDLRKREVPNWLNFSLVAFALSFRAFYSILNEEPRFFIFGLFGFFLFFILAHLFYYSRIFAGGDAKLLMGLGAVLPLPTTIQENFFIISLFIFLFLLLGSFYGLIYSSVLALKNRKKFAEEFKKQIKLKRTLINFGLLFFLISLILVFYLNEMILLFFPAIFLLFPLLLIYGKAVEESCMVKKIWGREATVGDWLYEEIKIGRKKFKPSWEGLNEREVKILRKYKKKIKIKVGIPFVPVFLFAFLFLFIFKDKFLWLLGF